MHVRSMQNVAKSLWGRIRGGGRGLAEVKTDDAQIDALRSENLMESVNLLSLPLFRKLVAKCIKGV